MQLRSKKLNGTTLFDVILVTIMAIFCLSIILPFIHVIAVSFSSKGPVMRNEVIFVPKGFTFENYFDMFKDGKWIRAYGIPSL